MALLLDIGIIVILIVTCIAGYIRGFKKYFIGIIAAVIVTAASAYSSNVLAEPVYDRYMRDSVNSQVRNAVEEFDPMTVIMEKLSEHELDSYVTDEEVDAALRRGGDYLENVGGLLQQKGADNERIDALRQNIDSYFGSEFTAEIDRRLEESGVSAYVNNVDISAEEIREYVNRAASQSKEDAADFIVEKAIKPALVGVIRSLLFSVCYAVFMLLIQLIIFISGVSKTIPEAKAADRFAGLVLGAIKGLLYCAVIAWVLSTMCSATEDNLSVFNSEISDQTYLFRYFFDFFYR